MIRIETYEGTLLSYEDSKQLIVFSIQKEFGGFSDFLSCEEIKSSGYWGKVDLWGPKRIINYG